MSRVYVENSAVVAAPTAAASATMPAVGTAHYYQYQASGNAPSGRFRGYIIVEDATGATVAIDRAEVEIYGYITADDKPALLERLVVSSATGRAQVPFDVDLCDQIMLHVRQGAVDAAVGVAGAQNPAFKYQLIWQRLEDD